MATISRFHDPLQHPFPRTLDLAAVTIDAFALPEPSAPALADDPGKTITRRVPNPFGRNHVFDRMRCSTVPMPGPAACCNLLNRKDFRSSSFTSPQCRQEAAKTVKLCTFNGRERPAQ
ncbi:MAG: hypothetical protein R6V61_05200 [Wenzhouxiangellaceae bacterium]